MANPLICVFNPVTTLIDEIPASSIFTGAGAAGTPVVLNLQGFIDPSLLGVGTHATAGEILNAGALVNLYNSGGSLFMQNAYAAAVGTAPSGAAYPISAMAFVANNVSIANTAQILFSGVFVYGDPNSEFSASDIGAEVYLSQITPGGVTKTRPSGPGQLQQSVGTVVGFSAPNFVQVSFVVQPQPQFNNFNNIATGTNTTAIMNVGSGASIVVSGTGVVQATKIQGVVVSGVAPLAGQALIATSPTAASWASTPAGVQILVTTVDTGAPAAVAVGDIVMWGSNYNDDGVVRAEYSANEVALIGVAQTAAAAGAAITIQISGSITANTATSIDVGQLISIDPANPGRGIANSPQLHDKTPPGDAQYVIGYSLAANVGTLFTLQIDPFASVKYVTPGVSTGFVGSGHQVQFDQSGIFGGDSAITVEKLGGITTLAIQQLYMSLPVVSPLTVNNAFGPTDVTTVLILSNFGNSVPVTNGYAVDLRYQNGSQSNSNGDGVRLASTTGAGLVSNYKAIHILAPASNTAPNLFTNFTGVYVDDPVSGSPFPGASPAYAFQAAGGISAFKGLAVGRVTVTTAYTALMSDQTILGNTTGGGFTIALPTTGIADGQVYTLKNIGSNTLTISSAGLIDGAASVLLTMLNDTLIVEWDGSALTYRILKGDDASASRTVRFNAGTVLAGQFSGPFTINFTPAFADNNYTVEATVVVGEALSTAPCVIAGVQQNGGGAGVDVWVVNNDTINHTVFVNIIARHD